MECEPTMTDNSNWWEQFFCDNFADLLLERSDIKKLAQDVDFIIDELQLSAQQILFDQCCGIGEIACALAQKGIYPIGVDLSESYILRAKEKAQNNQLLCEFHQGDAHTFISPKLADGAMNWYTSFGYSDNDTLNISMFINSYKSLKPGGRFILDYYNPAFIFSHFMERQIIHKTVPDGNMTVYKETRVDLERGMIMSSWRYVFPDREPIIKSGESRLYFARELIDMLKSCGFKIIGLKGDISGASFSKDSPRCIITAQK